MSDSPKILLVVGGGIAAYKSCELVRLIRKGGGSVTCVLTEGGAQFVTPMSLAALSENQVHTSLWDLKNEAEMGHIQLSREADLIVICPATADLLAKMAAGVADDLATTMILATDKPVLAVPAMNVRMWEHDSTQRNVAWLREAGVAVMDPDEGEMACGEFGLGRLPEPEMVWLEIAEKLGVDPGEASAKDVKAFLKAAKGAAESASKDDEEAEGEEEELAVEAAEGEAGAEKPASDEELLEALEPEEDEGEEEAEEEAAPTQSRLGSLLASIIPRSTPRKVEPDPEEEEAEDTADAAEGEASEGEAAEGEAAEGKAAEGEASEGEAAEGEASADDSEAGEDGGAEGEGEAIDIEAEEALGEAMPEEEDIPFDPDLGGGLLVTKGMAKSAPPTDREAINHEVNPNQVEPEAFEGEPAAIPAGDAPPSPPAASVAAPVVEEEPEFDGDPETLPLYGKHVLVTAGPTWESIDPVRYISNRSSGKQGFAIARAARRAGARVTLVAGPVYLETPRGVDRVDVESADEMAAAVKKALPADAAVMVAAVADWKPRDYSEEKIKKRGSAPPALLLTENPDILGMVAAQSKRPKVLVGFAAETENVVENAKKKRKSKGADWIVANDVSTGPDGSVMGGDRNQVSIVREKKVDTWDPMPKEDVAKRLVEKIADALEKDD